MATIDELLKPFAGSILCKVIALNELNLTSPQRARIRESISDDIKKCTNFIKPEVSQGAFRKAKIRHVDLYLKNWHDQPKFDARRELFHFEHIVPVSAIRELCENRKTKKAILEILKTRLRIAWILKREDQELTRLGYRSKRPDSAYGEAGIKLLPR